MKMTYANAQFPVLLLILYFGKLEAVVFLDPGCQPGFTPMMINGTNADRAPWMVYLMESGKYICGGSLVHSQFVLTAAHCAVSTDNLLARLGEYDTSTTEDGQIYDVRVTNSFPEPWGQDITLLKLAQTVGRYTDTIRPICIIAFLSIYEMPTFNSVNNFTVTGWGQISRTNKASATKLQEISVWRLHPSVCSSPAGQICCENPSQFVCHGDSGSPLTALSRYNYVTSTVQYGLLSYGHDKCYDYARYVDIVPYTAWIYNTIRTNCSTYI